MSKQLITLTFTEAQLSMADAALTELETVFIGLISLTADQKRATRNMGDKSEAFCREAVNVMQQNPHIMPPNIAVNDTVQDLLTHDQLRPRLHRIARLFERCTDTQFALGSDVMQAALQCYAQLKVNGRNVGLEGSRKALSALFAKGGRTPKEKAA